MDKLTELSYEMVRYERNVPHRIQHFLKVRAYAHMIGERENLDAHTLFVLEAAALVHDIGILPALEKYGSDDGPLQEKEGIAPAREMLTRLGFDESDIARICFLVSRHHTYTDIDGIDWQILLEADYLVNSHEGKKSKDAIQNAMDHFFRTESGKLLLTTMYGLGGKDE